MYKLICAIFIHILILSLGSAPIIIAQEGDGGHAGAFMRIGAGVRPLSMGGAFTAISDDITAAYWNPAGLGQLSSIQIMGMYSILTLDRKLNYVAAAFPGFGPGTIGLSLLNLSVSDIDGRDAFGDATGDFSDSENAFSLSYGMTVNDIVYFGGNVKFLMHSLAQNKASGFGGDVGLLLKLTKSSSVGIALQDGYSKMKWDTQSKLVEKIPMNLRVGVALAPFSSSKFRIAFDAEKTEKEKVKLHGGVEILPINQLAIRAGYNNGLISAGLSLKFPVSKNNLDLSYGVFNDVIDKAPIHRMSLLVEFNKETEKFDGTITGICAIAKIQSDNQISKGEILSIYRKDDSRKILEICNAKVVPLKNDNYFVEPLATEEVITIKKGDILGKEETNVGTLTAIFLKVEISENKEVSKGQKLKVYRKDLLDKFEYMADIEITTRMKNNYLAKALDPELDINKGDVLKIK